MLAQALSATCLAAVALPLACAPGGGSRPPLSGADATLFSDTFDDPAARKFQETPGVTTYRDGAFVFLPISDQLEARRGKFLEIPGSHRDAAVAVDVRAPQGVGVPALNCRQRGDLFYQVSVDIQSRRVQITKGEPGIFDILFENTSDSIRAGDQVNRIELICRGSQITVMVNGKEAGKLDDASYNEGQTAIGVRGQGEVRFDNLVVTRR